MTRRDEARTVGTAIDGLPDEQGRVTMPDTPVGTVKGRMRLGLRKLRDRSDELAMKP